MKILKNKTYNDLMLRLQKSESDLKKQIEKTNEVQKKFNYNCAIHLDTVEELEDKDVLINSLNERVQKAESECEKFKKVSQRCISENTKLMSENLELEYKLSRKGLGKKGDKKEKQ